MVKVLRALLAGCLPASPRKDEEPCGKPLFPIGKACSGMRLDIVLDLAQNPALMSKNSSTIDLLTFDNNGFRNACNNVFSAFY